MEYQNIIRDLLALDVDVESLLPADEGNYGFDNVGVAGLSPTLLERYLSAARESAAWRWEAPFVLPAVRPASSRRTSRKTVVLMGYPSVRVVERSLRIHFPLDAEYDIEVQLALNIDDHIQGLTERHQIEVMLDVERLESFTVEPVRATGSSVDRARDEGFSNGGWL